MAGRPEGTSGGYNDRGPDDYDRDAWQEFTPWRPGDPTTRGEAPASYAVGFESTALYRPSEDENAGRTHTVDREPPGQPPTGRPRSRWWTEDQPVRLDRGDRVTSRSAVGGAVFSHVPAGTEGRVTGTRSGLFGGDFATVEFANGYVEEVPTSELNRETGWF
ncbi:hypothetical protein [Amycolatopsis sp. NPDC051903]|uniref:hypothetical protein n=1 Tax=Amycolatopsis sp. NPDC051903 TaxID=3363936 RepID=UPI0037B0247C